VLILLKKRLGDETFQSLAMGLLMFLTLQETIQSLQDYQDSRFDQVVDLEDMQEHNYARLDEISLGFSEKLQLIFTDHPLSTSLHH
jgi:hypothetical protein